MAVLDSQCLHNRHNFGARDPYDSGRKQLRICRRNCGTEEIRERRHADRSWGAWRRIKTNTNG